MKSTVMDVLSHATGLSEALNSHDQKVGWRNLYVCGPGDFGYASCVEAVDAGLMVRHEVSWCPDPCFVATRAGLDLVRAEYARRRPPAWSVEVRDGEHTYNLRVLAKSRGAARARVAHDLCDVWACTFGEALRDIVSVRRA